ncbi:MAG: DUF4331 domain-containing protein [Deltaproteobacteria bacterium]|nr:DUF4331 domain-containing protein [Deltaproteobacteria bacterium]
MATHAGFDVRAADHLDGPAATADPTADITDFLAWMSPDTARLRMALDVVPFAGVDAAFSDAVGYVFHVGSAPAFGGATQEVEILCAFYSATQLECWLGDEYVVGDASDPAGITSESGALRVFAGPRNDPFFFEFGGFGAAVEAVKAAAPSLEFDADGCPALDEATANAVVGLLQSNPRGGPAQDTFAGANVMALVVEVDVDLVNGGGPVLAAWGSTHQLAR